MTRRQLHVRVLAALLLALLVPATPARAVSLAERIDAAVDASRAGSITSVYVWEQSSRQVLTSHAAARAVTPASTMKLLTSAAALERLGPDHRFRTRIALDGSRTGARFVGDVWLIGGGDPSLSTAGYARDNLGGHGANIALLARALRQQGIRSISGRIMVDDDLFDEARSVAEWPAGFAFQHAGAIGALTVNQSSLGRGASGRFSRDPDVHAGDVLRTLLRRQGVAVRARVASGSAPADALDAGHVDSPPLHTLLRHMNGHSDNLYAEVILKGIGADSLPGREGISTRDGRRAARSTLTRIGIDMTDVEWVDGSGLAYRNHVTARSLGHVLGMGAQAQWGPEWIDTFARAGEFGTLRHRLTRRPWRGRVIGKTGSLRHVSALAGFATRESGARYGFVVVSSGTPGEPIDSPAAKRLQERVARILGR